MKRDELLASRKNALERMEAAAKAENFVQADYDKAKNDVDALTAQINAFDTRSKFENELDSVIPKAGSSKDTELKAKMGAVLAYVRRGVIDPQNAVTIGGAANGAVLIPQEYAKSILKDLESETAIRKFATVVTTNGTYNMPIGGGAPTFG